MTTQNWTALASEAAELVWRNDARIDIIDFLEGFLEEKGIDLNDQTTTDNFDLLKKRCIRQVERRIAADDDRGVTPKYRVGSGNPDLLVPQQEPSKQKIRVLVKQAVRRLSWKGFERFCVHAFRIGGAEKSYTMRGTKDEGIDFFGLLDIGKVSDSSIWHNVEVRIIGQVKTYRVGEPRIRLFHADMESFVLRRGRAWTVAPKWFKDNSSPLVGFYLTSAGFTRDARSWAADDNIATLDLDQIVEAVVQHPKQTPGLSSADEGVFTESDFLAHFEEDRNWLAST